MTKTRITDLTFIALSTVLISICSWISIPFPIPFTMQTFAIFTVIMILGPLKSFYSIVLYILLGLVGLPVFSGFNSGISAIIGPTGGFIIGFIFLPLSYSLLTMKYKRNIFSILGLVIGLIVCYFFGSAWFMFVYTKGSVTLFEVLKFCVLPFLIPDGVKLMIAFYVSKPVRKFLVTIK